MSSSTFTPNLGIEQPATGMYANTWGTVANRSYAVIDAAISGNAQITIASAPGAPFQLNIGQGVDPSNAICPLIIWSGAQTAQGSVMIAPDTAQRLYLMRNQTSGGFSIAFQQGTGSQFVLQPGFDAYIYADGAGPNANVAAALANPQFNNLQLTGTLTGVASLGLGAPTSVPDPLTLSGFGPAGQAQLRLVAGSGANYGVLLRNDGNTLYLLTTNAGDPYGAFTTTYPLMLDLASGVVGLNGWGPLPPYSLSAPAIHSGSLATDGGITVGGNAANNGYSMDLRFGGASGEGIGSGRVPGGLNLNGLTLFTGSQPRVFLTNNGQVGINYWPPDPGHALCVAGYIHTNAGIIFPDGSLQTTATSTTFPQLTVNGHIFLHSGGCVIFNDGTAQCTAAVSFTGVGVWVTVPLFGTFILGRRPDILFSSGGSLTVGGQDDPANNRVDISYTYTSDARVKQNVRPLEGGLEVINQIHPVAAEFNGRAQTPKGSPVASVIAQELAAVFPLAVYTHRRKLDPRDEAPTDVLCIDPPALTYQCILGIQELDRRLRALEKRMEWT